MLTSGQKQVKFNYMTKPFDGLTEAIGALAETMVKNMETKYGFTMKGCIAKGVCIPTPIGCGGSATSFPSEKEEAVYQKSGLCAKCQAKALTDMPENLRKLMDNLGEPVKSATAKESKPASSRKFPQLILDLSGLSGLARKVLSTNAQKNLFKLGYRWPTDATGQQFLHTECPTLCINHSKEPKAITYSGPNDSVFPIPNGVSVCDEAAAVFRAESQYDVFLKAAKEAVELDKAFGGVS